MKSAQLPIHWAALPVARDAALHVKVVHPHLLGDARDGLDILALTNFRSGDAAHRNLELDMVTQFIADHEVEFAVGIAENERLRQRYGANGIPTYVVLDRAGIVRRASSKPDKVTLEQAIVGLLDTRQAVADD